MRKAGVGRGVPTLDSEEAPHWEPVALGRGHPPSPQLKRMGPKLHAAQVKASVTGRVKTEKQVGEGSCFVHTLW